MYIQSWPHSENVEVACLLRYKNELILYVRLRVSKGKNVVQTICSSCQSFFTDTHRQWIKSANCFQVIVDSEQDRFGCAFPCIVQWKCFYFLQPQRPQMSAYVLFCGRIFLSRVCKRRPGTFLSFFCHTSSPLVVLEMDTQPLYHQMVVLRH